MAGIADVGAQESPTVEDSATWRFEFANDAFRSGAFVASKTGVVGPLADQVEVFATAKQYGDWKKQDAAYKAVNEFL